MLTQELHSAVASLGHLVSIAPMDISVRSLRSSGAMALLCANIDSDCICLLGRWHFDEMLRYLHVQAYPVVAHLAPTMLQHGDFSFLPSHILPQPNLQLALGAHQGPVGC
jgi:hypothetical protein